MMASTTETSSLQIYDCCIKIHGEKKNDKGLVISKTSTADIYVDLDTNTVYATYRGKRYETAALGNCQYGFHADDGFYFTFTYVIN